MTFGPLIPGISAGLALGGAWLTSIGFMRGDGQIRLEDARYMDGGDTKVTLLMEASRIGRLGLAATAAAIVVPILVPPASAPLQGSVWLALATTLTVRVVGWLRQLIFRRIECPKEYAAAMELLAAVKARREAGAS